MAVRFPLSLSSFLEGRTEARASPLLAKGAPRFNWGVRGASSPPTLESTPRRSANYRPNLWDYDTIQSIRTEYTGESYKIRAEDLRQQATLIFEATDDPMAQMEVVDKIERLGIGYLFEDQIKTVLDAIYTDNIGGSSGNDLHAVARRFRILREHGYSVSPDVFNPFKDGDGSFITKVSGDVKGMLSLFEASCIALPGEELLDEAKAFTSKHLKAKMYSMEPFLREQVHHALELPRSRRKVRLEARYNIDVYKGEKERNPILLELAKLNFNMVQSFHVADLKEVFRWWRDTRLSEKLPFARERTLECFMVSSGVAYEPQYGRSRRDMAKTNILLTVIDDVYDVYGSIEELELFTEAVERWDLKAMESLPEYMKICYMALYNTVNQMAYDSLKEQSCCIIGSLSKAWAGLCKACLKEAKWFHSGYKPTLDEYLSNAYTSVAGPLFLIAGYFLSGERITQEVVDFLEQGPKIVWFCSIILRLTNDMGTSTDEQERGDVLKSIQCYMQETGASEEQAREHIKDLINDIWKHLHQECSTPSPLPKTFMKDALNIARSFEFMYQYGDGFGVTSSTTLDHFNSLLFQPICVDV
ncbi:hypothetical protein AMTRI_Chr13g124310 [Amborella trichopoda]